IPAGAAPPRGRADPRAASTSPRRPMAAGRPSEVAPPAPPVVSMMRRGPARAPAPGGGSRMSPGARRAGRPGHRRPPRDAGGAGAGGGVPGRGDGPEPDPDVRAGLGAVRRHGDLSVGDAGPHDGTRAALAQRAGLPPGAGMAPVARPDRRVRPARPAAAAPP